jgi:uncharacterized protein YbjT (DUF2867 family)
MAQRSSSTSRTRRPSRTRPSWSSSRPSGRNLLAAEAAAGVRHHVALSVVGTDRNPDSGYLRAKLAQETLIKASGIPYTILQATQFFEFVGAIVQSSAEGDAFRLSPALFQPVAADDVAALLAELAVAAPANGTVELAGRTRSRWMRSRDNSSPPRMTSGRSSPMCGRAISVPS